MNNFLLEIFQLSAIELQAACDEHASTYPNGDWQAANTRIGIARLIADSALHASGLWPSTERYLSNESVMKLLQAGERRIGESR